jgi:DNA polymerase III subunit epsilon
MDDTRYGMDTSRTQARTVVFDTETTGLSAASRIVEFAAVEVAPRTGRIVRRLHYVVDPRVPIPAAVTRIHGIGGGDVVGKPTFEQVAGELSGFLRGATLVAQNAAFDCRLLDAELARAGGPLLGDLGMRVVDTVAVARALFPLEAHHNLDSICDRVGVDRTCRRRHGALVDAQLLARALPHFAAAYDAWCASDDAPNAGGLEEFERPLHLLCEQLATQSDTRNPERADRAFSRVGMASSWMRRRERDCMEHVEGAVSAAGWCSKRFAARWSSSQNVSWKDAAIAHLTQTDLAPFQSETWMQVLRPRLDDDANVAAQLFAPLGALGRAPVTAPLPSILGATFALKQARDQLETIRQQLRAALLVAVADGYHVRYATLDRGLSTRTDYRGALAALAPDADLSPFTSDHRRLTIRSRDLAPCEVLFGNPADRARAARIENVA